MSVYAIAQGKIEDRKRFDRYVAEATPTLLAHDAKVLAIDETPVIVEGAIDYPRTVILEFESEAAAKNISTNMLITAVNGRSIAGLGDWEDALESVSPGKPLKVDLLAGSQQGWRPLSVFLRAPESR